MQIGVFKNRGNIFNDENPNVEKVSYVYVERHAWITLQAFPSSPGFIHVLADRLDPQPTTPP